MYIYKRICFLHIAGLHISVVLCTAGLHISVVLCTAGLYICVVMYVVQLYTCVVCNTGAGLFGYVHLHSLLSYALHCYMHANLLCSS